LGLTFHSPVALAARSLGPIDVERILKQANSQASPGSLAVADHDVVVQTGAFFTSAADVGAVVVGVYQGSPVYLRDVATIADGAEEPSQYVFFGKGAAASATSDEEPAVTLSIAKRPGTNAIKVADAVLERLDRIRPTSIPGDVSVSITRHYGATAAEKSNELLMHMGIAVVSVSLLILFMLGWRESVVVAVAIPATLALTLLVFYLGGYTLNRITLFALIFSIGILAGRRGRLGRERRRVTERRDGAERRRSGNHVEPELGDHRPAVPSRHGMGPTHILRFQPAVHHLLQGRDRRLRPRHGGLGGRCRAGRDNHERACGPFRVTGQRYRPPAMAPAAVSTIARTRRRCPSTAR
jgi:hypothetical protein